MREDIRRWEKRGKDERREEKMREEKRRGDEMREEKSREEEETRGEEEEPIQYCALDIRPTQDLPPSLTPEFQPCSPTVGWVP